MAVAVLQGLVIGLSAVGLYSGTRNVLGRAQTGKGAAGIIPYGAANNMSTSGDLPI